MNMKRGAKELGLVNPILRGRLDALKRVCTEYRVLRLELFGSAAGMRFNPDSSDIDFLVEFQDMEPIQHAEAYLGLVAALRRIFRRRVDLVETRAITNPYFLRSVNKGRVVIYAA